MIDKNRFFIRNVSFSFGNWKLNVAMRMKRWAIKCKQTDTHTNTHLHTIFQVITSKLQNFHELLNLTLEFVVGVEAFR